MMAHFFLVVSSFGTPKKNFSSSMSMSSVHVLKENMPVFEVVLQHFPVPCENHLDSVEHITERHAIRILDDYSAVASLQPQISAGSHSKLRSLVAGSGIHDHPSQRRLRNLHAALGRAALRVGLVML
jgi:hypothetical protein